MEVHISFWLQVCTVIYLICGKKLKAEYQFFFIFSEQMDAAALMRFNFIGLESRGICNPAMRYIEASELDPNIVTFFHENGKTDSPDTICKLNFLPWQCKNEYEQLINDNPSCILSPATSAASLQVKRSAQTSTFKSDFWLWRHERTNFESTIKFRWMRDMT